MLDNGGHWLLPSVIDVVQDRNGRIIYQKGVKGCPSCFVAAGPRIGGDTSPLYRAIGTAEPAAAAVPDALWGAAPVVYEPVKRAPLADPGAIRDIVDVLQQVIQRGTGTLIKPVASQLAQPLAGKTGTSSHY
jgi:penicillin-binding protein 1A